MSIIKHEKQGFWDASFKNLENRRAEKHLFFILFSSDQIHVQLLDALNLFLLVLSILNFLAHNENLGFRKFHLICDDLVGFEVSLSLGFIIHHLHWPISTRLNLTYSATWFLLDKLALPRNKILSIKIFKIKVKTQFVQNVLLTFFYFYHFWFFLISFDWIL